jgi:hypothetical protein
VVFNYHFITNTQSNENKIYYSGFALDPNPAKEFIIFDLENISSSAKVELFDLQGKKVMEQKLSEIKEMSVSNLHRGLYLYRLCEGKNMYIGKITIE